ncbi:unnamed protein product, partial [Protopolystoma xenopodis]
ASTQLANVPAFAGSFGFQLPTGPISVTATPSSAAAIETGSLGGFSIGSSLGTARNSSPEQTNFKAILLDDFHTARQLARANSAQTASIQRSDASNANPYVYSIDPSTLPTPSIMAHGTTSHRLSYQCINPSASSDPFVSVNCTSSSSLYPDLGVTRPGLLSGCHYAGPTTSHLAAPSPSSSSWLNSSESCLFLEFDANAFYHIILILYFYL